jgi:hypothetical protein
MGGFKVLFGDGDQARAKLGPCGVRVIEVEVVKRLGDGFGHGYGYRTAGCAQGNAVDPEELIAGAKAQIVTPVSPEEPWLGKLGGWSGSAGLMPICASRKGLDSGHSEGIPCDCWGPWFSWVFLSKFPVNGLSLQRRADIMRPFAGVCRAVVCLDEINEKRRNP